MLADKQISALENGDAFDENHEIRAVNEEFRVNRWKHRDIPLPEVENPITFEASESRKQAIKAGDSEALQELADARAKALEQQNERANVEALRNAELRRKDSEIDDLRRQLRAQQDRNDGAPAGVPLQAPAGSEGIVPGATAEDGTIPSLGRPNGESTMTEIQEWMQANNVPSPNGKWGVSLNTYGKPGLLKWVDEFLTTRENGQSDTTKLSEV